MNNKGEARLLAKYWITLFRKATSHSNRRWVPMYPPDLTDGNPVLCFISRDIRPYRSLRVIQNFNYEKLPELRLGSNEKIYFGDDAYVPFAPMLNQDSFDVDGETPVEELVISSDISDDCENCFNKFVDIWCVMNVNAYIAEDIVDGYWKMVDSRLVRNTPEPDLPEDPHPGM